jgi:hypothetical protein
MIYSRLPGELIPSRGPKRACRKSSELVPGSRQFDHRRRPAVSTNWQLGRLKLVPQGLKPPSLLPPDGKTERRALPKTIYEVA